MQARENRKAIRDEKTSATLCSCQCQAVTRDRCWTVIDYSCDYLSKPLINRLLMVQLIIKHLITIRLIINHKLRLCANNIITCQCMLQFTKSDLINMQLLSDAF